jgi:hypothetical protein
MLRLSRIAVNAKKKLFVQYFRYGISSPLFWVHLTTVPRGVDRQNNKRHTKQNFNYPSMGAPKDSKAVAVTAETEEKKKKEDKQANKLKKSEEELKEDTMSEEDKELKERLDTCVSTVINEMNEENVTIPLRLTALDVIVNELRTATASMTSVPKPLKFLRPHFGSLKTLYISLEKTESATMDVDSLEFRARLADVLAVLAMTMGKQGEGGVSILSCCCQKYSVQDVRS